MSCYELLWVADIALILKTSKGPLPGNCIACPRAPTSKSPGGTGRSEVKGNVPSGEDLTADLKSFFRFPMRISIDFLGVWACEHTYTRANAYLLYTYTGVHIRMQMCCNCACEYVCVCVYLCACVVFVCVCCMCPCAFICVCVCGNTCRWGVSKSVRVPLRHFMTFCCLCARVLQKEKGKEMEKWFEMMKWMMKWRMKEICFLLFFSFSLTVLAASSPCGQGPSLCQATGRWHPRTRQTSDGFANSEILVASEPQYNQCCLMATRPWNGTLRPSCLFNAYSSSSTRTWGMMSSAHGKPHSIGKLPIVSLQIFAKNCRIEFCRILNLL